MNIIAKSIVVAMNLLLAVGILIAMNFMIVSSEKLHEILNYSLTEYIFKRLLLVLILATLSTIIMWPIWILYKKRVPNFKVVLKRILVIEELFFFICGLVGFGISFYGICNT